MRGESQSLAGLRALQSPARVYDPSRWCFAYVMVRYGYVERVRLMLQLNWHLACGSANFPRRPFWSLGCMRAAGNIKSDHPDSYQKNFHMQTTL